MKANTPPGEKRRGPKSHHYDRIWRENLHAVLPGLIQKALRIDMVRNETLPDKVHLTQQRETDFLGKVTDTKGNTFILHIEIQARDDPEMAHRMAVYKTMTEQVYKLPVKQFVVYLGEKPSAMPTRLSSPGLQFEYTLIQLSALPYRLFLASDKPEEKLLAVLADFGKERVQVVLRKIMCSIAAVCPESVPFANRHYRHLRIFAQLRNLDFQLEKAMESVSTFFKEERDIFFIRGERKGMIEGEKKERDKLIRNMLKIPGLTDKQIAQAAEVSIKYIVQLRERHKSE